MIGPSPSASCLASVIVPCFDQLAFTRQCVASLARHTRPPWELIVVDNGSTDGTASYLAGISDVASFPVTILTNAENRGFPAGCNQGIAAARGEFVVLLNNDVVVTDGWLDQLVALARVDPAIGMVGPMSNYTCPPQVVLDAKYADLDQMDRFATTWRQQHRGQWVFAEKLSGFCLLIRRRVLEAIGGLDEGFGLGFFDDDDLAMRARSAGFELAVAVDLFVHHHGSRTFAGAGIDAESLLETNRLRFEQKWGIDSSSAQAVSLVSWGNERTATISSGIRPAMDPSHRTWTKLFGVGLPRTGTTSIAMAMLELGLRTAHACFDEALFDVGDAFFDTPVYVDYPELDRRYPGSKFILTWRDPHAWYASFARNLGPYLCRLRTQSDLDPDQLIDRRCYTLAFGADELGEDAFLKRYHDHRRCVEEYFMNRPGDLLVLDLDATIDLWEPICRFLSLPRPDRPFPRINASAIDRWLTLWHPLKLVSRTERVEAEVL
ncbi:sulfotransferase [Singulisphaera acidiphila]|uniref:Putative glycosyltransferase n=1 Tax=Singulisphaera acidiphila (strain ATCC BAA-1392 / DSM 18658 / VKM B-2454 / MOB10) TaxID=886293 RepID=L0D7F5_SINAD|nr:sulfotransferase [Singulisphaera acidiphila]AGA24795.1 putative glycosyltransferase [Singulisphaera acidiphila DSM 18658]